MVGESCLLEEAGSKWHENYTLERRFPSTSCSCFKIQLVWTAAGLMTVCVPGSLPPYSGEILGMSLDEAGCIYCSKGSVRLTLLPCKAVTTIKSGAACLLSMLTGAAC